MSSNTRDLHAAELYVRIIASAVQMQAREVMCMCLCVRMRRGVDTSTLIALNVANWKEHVKGASCMMKF